WVGEHPLAPWPSALYGAVLLACGLAWVLLERAIIANEGPDCDLAKAVGGKTLKEKLSPIAYAVGIGLAFVRTWVAQLTGAAVAPPWYIPDRRIEQRVHAR